MSSDSLASSSGELTFSKKRLESRPLLQLDSFVGQVPTLYSPDMLSPKSLPAPNGFAPDAPRSPSQFCSLLTAAISADDAERKSRGEKNRAACCLSLVCKGGSILRKDSTPSPSRKASENLDGNQHPRFMDLPAPQREPQQKPRTKNMQYWDTHSQAGPSRPPATRSETSPPRRSLTFHATPEASRPQRDLTERTPIARSQSEAGRLLPAFVCQTGLVAGEKEGRRASTSLLPPLQPSLSNGEAALEADLPPRKTRTLQFAENPADPIEWHERSISRSSRRSASGSAESSAPLPPEQFPEGELASPPASDSGESDDGNESDDETDSDYQAQPESESDDEEDEERGLNWKSRADWIDAGPSMIRRARSLPASPRRQSVLRMKRSPVAISAMLPDAFDDSTASSSPVSSYSATTAATTISSKPRSSAELSTPWSPVQKMRRAFSTADARAKPSLASTNFQVTMSLSPQMGGDSSLVSSPSLTAVAPSSPIVEQAGEDREDALRLLRCCLRAANFFADESEDARVISEPATPGLSS